MRLIIKRKGGKGSGNYGHEGRPGKVGGSASGGGGGGAAASGGKRGTMEVLEEINDIDEDVFSKPGIVGSAAADWKDAESLATQYVDFMKGEGVKVRPGRLNVDNIHYFISKGKYKAELYADYDNTDSVFSQFNDVLMDLGYNLLDYSGGGDMYAVAIMKPGSK